MKVINFYGGPNSGKSTKAAGLYYKMNMAGYSVELNNCLLYTSPSPRDVEESRMPSSA